MVEVDVFWSYGLAAGLGLASARHAQGKPFAEGSWGSPHLRDTLLYLACAFAPSGVALVWAFPDWETMHLGSREMPHWLVALFAATNVTQGLAGFLLARWLVQRGQPYLAYLQWVAGYFAMFFILVHGWDGSGYQRFFSPTAADLPGWTWDTAARWLTSPVAHTLEVEGVLIVPPLLFLMARWWTQGYALAGVRPALTAWGLAWSALCFPALVVPLLAVGASGAVRVCGWPLGLLAFAGLAWLLLLRPGALLHRHFAQLHHGTPFFSRALAGAPAGGHAAAP